MRIGLLKQNMGSFRGEFKATKADCAHK